MPACQPERDQRQGDERQRGRRRHGPPFEFQPRDLVDVAGLLEHRLQRCHWPAGKRPAVNVGRWPVASRKVTSPDDGCSSHYRHLAFKGRSTAHRCRPAGQRERVSSTRWHPGTRQMGSLKPVIRGKPWSQQARALRGVAAPARGTTDARPFTLSRRGCSKSMKSSLTGACVLRRPMLRNMPLPS